MSGSPKQQNRNAEHHSSPPHKNKNDFNMQTSQVRSKSKSPEEKKLDRSNSGIKKSSRLSPTNQKQKMIQQNMKLKSQIYELASQMDEIMSKEKKKKYGIHTEDDDEIVKEKKMILEKQQIQIMQLKNKIFLTKRQLQHVYDSQGIQSKEDQIRAAKRQIKALESEKEGLLRVKREQNKALKVMRNDEEYEYKLIKLKEQLSKIKEECKILSEKITENDRILRKNHEQYMSKQGKIKEMENRIEENKKKLRKGQNQKVVTVEMIGQIQQQINELEKDRKESEKSWGQKINNIQTQLHQRQIEEQKKLLILKEKDKQLKLNQIRLKELKKLLQHSNAQLSGSRKQSEETDMKEFRHKRNIKYMDK